MRTSRSGSGATSTAWGVLGRDMNRRQRMRLRMLELQSVRVTHRTRTRWNLSLLSDAEIDELERLALLIAERDESEALRDVLSDRQKEWTSGMALKVGAQGR